MFATQLASSLSTDQFNNALCFLHAGAEEGLRTNGLTTFLLKSRGKKNGTRVILDLG